MIGKIKSFFAKEDGYSVDEVVVKTLYRQRKALHIMLRIVAGFELLMMGFGLMSLNRMESLGYYIVLYFILGLVSVISDLILLQAEKKEIEERFKNLKGFAYAYYIITICWGLALTTLDKLNGGTYWVAATIIIVSSSFIKLHPLFQCIFTLLATSYMAGLYVWLEGKPGLGIVNILFFGGVVCFIILKDYRSIYNNLYLEKKLTDMSLRDGLTSAFNRRALEKVIKSNSTEKVRCVSIVDLDDYSENVDNISRKAKDDAMLLATVYLREQFSDKEIFRYGGDEFLILSESVSEETLEKLEKINYRLDMSDREIKFNIYGGISLVHGKDDVAECIERADLALYNAKKSKTKHFAIET